jgi:hypothetical protein
MDWGWQRRNLPRLVEFPVEVAVQLSKLLFSATRGEVLLAEAGFTRES